MPFSQLLSRRIELRWGDSMTSGEFNMSNETSKPRKVRAAAGASKILLGGMHLEVISVGSCQLRGTYQVMVLFERILILEILGAPVTSNMSLAVELVLMIIGPSFELKAAGVTARLLVDSLIHGDIWRYRQRGLEVSCDCVRGLLCC